MAEETVYLGGGLTAIARPVQSLERPEVREEVCRAGIIVGRDPRTGAGSLFYGKEMLEDIAKGRQHEFGPQRAVAFLLDFRTIELEYLIAAVQVLKGSCCYNE
jgi:hypothetical protein